MTIFAAFNAKNILLMLICNSYFYGYTIAVSNDTRLSNPRRLLQQCYNVLGRMGGDSLSYFIIFHSTMPRAMEDYSSANNSTAAVTSAHETCSQFLDLVRKQYPQLHCVTYRKSHKWYIFRAQIKKRRLYSHGYTPEYAMARFSLEILRKLFLERYLSESEYRARKQELHRRVIMEYGIYELPAGGNR